jgi:PEP-CTERM motif
MMHLLKLVAAFAISLLGLTSAASATEMYVSSMSLANGYEMVEFQPVEPSDPSWAGGWEYTGQQELTANYGTSNRAPYFNVFAWCVDVYDDIYIGSDSIVYNLVPLTVVDASEIEKLAAWGDKELASGPNPLISAAVQAAIWDLEYNMEIVPGSNPAVEQEVASINALLPSLPAADGAMLSGDFAGDGSIAQTLYTVATPEPASLTLLGIGLVAAAVARSGWRPVG